MRADYKARSASYTHHFYLYPYERQVPMQHLSILLMSALCSSCALRTFDIPIAPKATLEPNLAVVFDIDGTLTPKPSASGIARANAVNAARLYADNGYKIIYLSARRRTLQSRIPKWLTKNGFPEGSIQVPQNSNDSSDNAAFKTRILNEFKGNGWKLVGGYGDSDTDFEAYFAAGIAKDDIFALRVVDEEACDPGPWAKCLDSWAEHLDHIAQKVQP